MSVSVEIPEVPRKKEPRAMLKLAKSLKVASRSFTNKTIDYSAPNYDLDWLKSRQKLQPILSVFGSRTNSVTSGMDHNAEYNYPLRRESASSTYSYYRSHKNNLNNNINKKNKSNNNNINNINNKNNNDDDDLNRSPFTKVPSYNRQRAIISVQHVIKVPIQTLTMLLIKPGELNFLIWYFISMYFPLITACLGPIANLISMVGLIEPWRLERSTGKSVHDYGFFLTFNICLLILGLLGNVSLLMNFSGRVRYLISQSVLICCWVTASLMLTAAVAVLKVKFFNGDHSKYTPSEAYFFAVITAGFYLLCLTILIVNFLGYKLKKYPPSFNLGPKQRSLMIFTIVMAIWLFCGTVLFAHMIPDLSYGALLYFCSVSVLTIGLGDIVPLTPGAKVLSLLFSIIGVLILGLIVTMIRQVVLSAGGPTIFWHMIEKERLKELKRQRSGIHPTITKEQLYNRMREIRKDMQRKQKRISLLLTILNFIAFWLVGATVFYFTEGWNYFNGFYFCFLCLITIGYGDFHPVTPLGRAFFVCWGIGAVPLMTILISNVGDYLYDFAVTLSFHLARIFFPDYYRYLLAKKKRKFDDSEDEGESDNLDVKKLVVESMSAKNLDDIEEFFKKERRQGIDPEMEADEVGDEEVAALASDDEDSTTERDLGDVDEDNNVDDDIENGRSNENDELSDSKQDDDENEIEVENSSKNSNKIGPLTLEEMDRQEILILRKTITNNLREDDLASISSNNSASSDVSLDSNDNDAVTTTKPNNRQPSQISQSLLRDFTPQLTRSTFSGEFELKLQVIRIQKEAERMSQLFKLVESTLGDVIDDPDKLYDHDEWKYYLRKLSRKPNFSEDYWLSEESPLRLPLSEPKYLMTNFFVETRKSVESLMKEIEHLKKQIEKPDLTRFNPSRTSTEVDVDPLSERA